MPLDLVVPDLFPPALDSPDRPDFRLPALERWLARAEATREPGMSARRWIAGRFGLADPVPYAAIGAAAEGLDLAAPLLRADPVHLAVDRDSVTLHEAGLLGVMAQEAEALVAALNDFFRDDGLAFLAAAPDRWYVRVPEGEVPGTVPIDQVAGGNVFGRLPLGSGHINWGSALTEAQMLFAAHAVNAEREAKGRPAINGVWFWGEGAAPASLPRAYDAVHGGDAFARGLAKLSGVEAPQGDANVLRILDAPSLALRTGDTLGWQRALEALEAEWFAGLDALSARHGAVRLVVPGRDATRVYVAGRKPLIAWPRAPRPWTAHA